MRHSSRIDKIPVKLTSEKESKKNILWPSLRMSTKTHVDEFFPRMRTIFRNFWLLVVKTNGIDKFFERLVFREKRS